jgi:nijmegen breakage syndrome protein 1
MYVCIFLFSVGEKYLLFVDVENVVGRKDCSIILKNDPAISRKHAVITVTHPENHVVSH